MDITRFKCTNYPTVTCSKTLFRIKASELIMTSGNVNIEFNLARPESYHKDLDVQIIIVSRINI